jgi:Flp pilus assembly protein protease CpaA
MNWVPLLFILVATYYDLKTREVPDAVPLSLLGWAVAASAFGWHDVGWTALLGGLAIGFGLSVVLFALGGLGGGDVKMISALGAALGPRTLLPVLGWIALAGGLLALVALVRGRRDLPYLPAIALGLLVDLLW